MCFSATASFVAAGAAGAVGVVTLSRAEERRALPLAATPVLFGMQQAVEGLLWLRLPVAPEGADASGLTLLFLLFAEVFWPIYAPTAVLLVEPDRRRRRLIALCLAAGVGVGAWMGWWILGQPASARILDGHIAYATGYKGSDFALFVYLAATALPLLLSSHRTVIVLGAIVLVGATVSYGFYREAFVSVWCFFAAAASIAILWHFERSHRHRLRLAGT